MKDNSSEFLNDKIRQWVVGRFCDPTRNLTRKTTLEILQAIPADDARIIIDNFYLVMPRLGSLAKVRIASPDYPQNNIELEGPIEELPFAEMRGAILYHLAEAVCLNRGVSPNKPELNPEIKAVLDRWGFADHVQFEPTSERATA